MDGGGGHESGIIGVVPAVTDLDLPELDYTDGTLSGARYHRELRALREQGWLARTALGFVVLDREAGEEVLRSKRARFPGKEIAELFGIESGPLREEIDRNVLHLDGDAHRRLRHIVNPFFTPKAADAWRPAMRGFLEELWEPLSQAGGCDAVVSICRPYPGLAIAAVVGAPRDDARRLHHWSGWIQKQFDPPSLMTQRAQIEEAVEEFYVWCHALLAAKREAPAEDLASTLLAADLDDDERVNLVLNVLVGGVDTTQSQLAHALLLFAHHPDQWAALAEDPGLAPQAVEEVLRHEPITPFTARRCLEPIEINGVTFPEGTILLVCSWTANRDGVADGETFDIRRPRGDRLLTFGAGIHYCLGSNLARVELEEALVFLAPRTPGLAPAGEPELGGVQGIYGIESLPIAWG
jgi:cytochrome P450